MSPGRGPQVPCENHSSSRRGCCTTHKQQKRILSFLLVELMISQTSFAITHRSVSPCWFEQKQDNCTADMFLLYDTEADMHYTIIPAGSQPVCSQLSPKTVTSSCCQCGLTERLYQHQQLCKARAIIPSYAAVLSAFATLLHVCAAASWVEVSTWAACCMLLTPEGSYHSRSILYLCLTGACCCTDAEPGHHCTVGPCCAGTQTGSCQQRLVM